VRHNLGQENNALINCNSYAEFFSLAKELTTLENDLLELKASLAEWKSMPSLLNIDDYTSTGWLLVPSLTQSI
jgi:hypothetical protein